VLGNWSPRRRHSCVGGVVDVAATTILAIPLAIYAMSKFNLLDAPKGSSQVAVASAIHASPWLYGIQLLIGLGCSFLGGYVGAWVGIGHPTVCAPTQRKPDSKERP
jgi:hypothetical protein